MKSKRVKKPEGSRTRSKGAMSPPPRRPEVVYCEMIAPAFYVGYTDPLPVRKFATDWIFEFRANVPANHLRGIEAYTYFAQWRIAPKLPGRLAAIVELKDRAIKKRIELLEVFGVWGPV